jgi:hypothetical protein
MASLLTAVLAGCGEENPPPPAAEEESTNFSSIPGLSFDQSRTVEEHGSPDHFFISSDPDNSDRVERWIYFSLGRAIDFDNGRLFAEETVEDESSKYPPTDLRPQDFDASLTPGEALRMLGEPLYTREAQDSLMPENTIIVYEKAALLYHAENLIGVDTQVIPPEIDVP